MGEQVNPIVQTVLTDCFPSTSFDAIHRIEGNVGSLSFSGTQRVCLCFSGKSTLEITVEQNSQVAIYTCFEQYAESELTISCKENAQCTNYIVQRIDSLQKLVVKQESYSTYTSGMFQLAGQKDSIELLVEKNGNQANTNLYGVFFPSKQESYSIATRVNHQTANCETEELFRGIADEEGTGSFYGLVYVARDAQKTLAKQQNRNMLLSKTAHIHSEPQLEIYADDVVCTHGSSTGQIDAEALWYMQARGINRQMATKLLVAGFANDVLQKIADENLQEHISQQIAQKLMEQI